MPAAVLAVLTLVIPTVGTVRTSMRAENFLDRSEYVGFDNYSAVFDDPRLWPALGFSLSLVVAPIFVAVVVAPLLAAAVNWAGGWARWTARVALSLSLVVFSPVAMAIAWQRSFRDDPARLADPDLTAGTLRSSVGMMTFGVVCAVGLMVFLPVFRTGEQRRPMWPALFSTAGVVALGLLAVGLQQFTAPFVMTAFGPRDETMTPVGLLFANAFRNLQAGMGAAVATVLLVLLAVLGVAAVLVVVLTRLRVSLLPSRQGGGRPTPPAIVIGALALVAVVVVAVLNMLPWFDALSGASPESPSGAQGRTWTWAVPGALVSVGVAYLAALGISGLRPLGRHSEWLLMPFAPWLFVGAAPLSVEFFKSLRESGDLDTMSTQPILVSVVSLVILAVVCRGQSARWQQRVAVGEPAAGTFLSTVVLPTLPLAGLLAVVTTLFNAQDLLWPLLTVSSPENGTVPLTLYSLHASAPGPDFSLASATPLLAVVLAFAALVATQVFYLDRMVATTGREQPSDHA
jgi:ABC-type sugar transport system permease subunit